MGQAGSSVECKEAIAARRSRQTRLTSDLLDDEDSYDDVGPTPVPPSKRVIKMPQDQYLHPGAPTEWWWHIGTLVAVDDPSRVFGFEINAASFTEFGFTQCMLSDAKNNVHYHQTQGALFFNPNTWAQSDSNKDWTVLLNEVWMSGPKENPIANMTVKAALIDADSLKPVVFDLTMSQVGPIFDQWGTGLDPSFDPPPAHPDVTNDNFYYSLTRLQVSGTVQIGLINPEKIAVKGQTWMDHQYGVFGTPTDRPKWILQNLQLENGVHICNYTLDLPKEGKQMDAFATVQKPDGTEYYVRSFCTPFNPWTSKQSTLTYFMQWVVELPDFNARFTVESVMDQQEFYTKFASCYEGAAYAKGIWEGESTQGPAWNEQALPQPWESESPQGEEEGVPTPQAATPEAANPIVQPPLPSPTPSIAGSAPPSPSQPPSVAGLSPPTAALSPPSPWDLPLDPPRCHACGACQVSPRPSPPLSPLPAQAHSLPPLPEVSVMQQGAKVRAQLQQQRQHFKRAHARAVTPPSTPISTPLPSAIAPPAEDEFKEWPLVDRLPTRSFHHSRVDTPALMPPRAAAPMRAAS